MKLTINNLYKKYDFPVLKDINFNIADKHVIAIIGPSGGGKSTLLRLLAGVEFPENGEIIINDYNVNEKDIKEYHKKIGFVFQNHCLFPHLSVLRNITLILEKIHKIGKHQANVKAKNLLKQFGLESQASKKPGQISGGQSQRASIVRSLAINPEILFFDEPTSSLDPILTYEVLDTILTLKKEKKDFIIVTHEIGFAKEVADHIIFIDQGKIMEHGSKDILNNPKTEELKMFLSKIFTWHNSL